VHARASLRIWTSRIPVPRFSPMKLRRFASISLRMNVVLNVTLTAPMMSKDMEETDELESGGGLLETLQGQD